MHIIFINLPKIYFVNGAIYAIILNRHSVC